MSTKALPLLVLCDTVQQCARPARTCHVPVAQQPSLRCRHIHSTLLTGWEWPTARSTSVTQLRVGAVQHIVGNIPFPSQLFQDYRALAGASSSYFILSSSTTASSPSAGHPGEGHVQASTSITVDALPLLSCPPWWTFRFPFSRSWLFPVLQLFWYELRSCLTILELRSRPLRASLFLPYELRSYLTIRELRSHTPPRFLALSPLTYVLHSTVYHLSITSFPTSPPTVSMGQRALWPCCKAPTSLTSFFLRAPLLPHLPGSPVPSLFLPIRAPLLPHHPRTPLASLTSFSLPILPKLASYYLNGTTSSPAMLHGSQVPYELLSLSSAPAPSSWLPGPFSLPSNTSSAPTSPSQSSARILPLAFSIDLRPSFYHLSPIDSPSQSSASICPLLSQLTYVLYSTIYHLSTPSLGSPLPEGLRSSFHYELRS
ncbi:hypothetical protein B0H13DRAFT_2300920 [Mycena leptocephala]|nr:hypothetical protein B0H13DRAFT_2300920 [Mycena leptocephala]